jgi:Rho termination factor, N-terminal domain
MKISNILGSLMHLYIDEIDPGDATDAPEFLIKATAKILKQKGGRNWIPVIVKETGEDRYQVISNSFVYAVAEEAGLERVWCIIADDNDDTTTLTKILAGEEKPKINLSTASRDEIMAALQYLIEQPNSDLKSVKLAVATNRIDEAPRQYWKNFEPITSLKCGITKGKKLDAIKSVFYLTPQSMPDTINDVTILRTMTTVELKAIAKKRGIAGITKMKKDALIEALS